MSNLIKHTSAEVLRKQQAQSGTDSWSVSLPNAMLAYFEIEPNKRFGPESHNRDQITLVLEGCLYLEFGDESLRVEQGDVVSVPANTPHSLVTLDEKVRAVDAWSRELAD